MTPETYAYIQSQSHPLEVLPTDLAPKLGEMPDLKAVFFDIYGTLLISSSGDVGTLLETLAGPGFQETLQFAGIPPEIAEQYSPASLQQVILGHHAAALEEGVEYPEVDIIAIWEELLLQVIERDHGLQLQLDETALENIALRYELQSNPVWPMPGASACLQNLRERGLRLGVISNAQFFTPELFPPLLGYNLEDLGFHPSLQIFSYQYLEAKPSSVLYETAVESLSEFGITPQEVLYVGNDMLKDIWPAQQVGFRTALFAGDARSLRLREDDERVREMTPDLILTDLLQIPDCLGW